MPFRRAVKSASSSCERTLNSRSCLAGGRTTKKTRQTALAAYSGRRVIEGLVVRVIIYKLVDPQRGGHEEFHFRSRTKDELKLEVYALLLAHFVIRALMLEAATAATLNVDHLSFWGALQALKTRLPEQAERCQAPIAQRGLG
ncbi:MAG: hypothetical protein RLY70_4661 [Planctomycetota bacterium]